MIKRASFMIFTLLVFLVASIAFAVSFPGESSIVTIPPLDIGKNVVQVGHLGGAAHSVAVQGNYAYIGTGDEFAVLDITAPTNPIRIAYLVLPGLVLDIKTSGAYAYVAYLDFVMETYGVYVLNISEPLNPVVIGSYFFSEAKPNPQADVFRNMVQTGNELYILTVIRLIVLDVSIPDTPTELTSFYFAGLASTFDVANNYTFISTYGNPGDDTGRVLDLSDPANPVEVGTIRMASGWHVDMSEKFVYLTTYGGLIIVDITSPTNPIQAGFYSSPDPRHITVLGDYAYVIDADLLVIDVSDPHNPIAVGAYNLPSGAASDMTSLGEYLYISGYYDILLQVVNISTPTTPMAVGFYKQPGHYERLAFNNSYLYNIENVPTVHSNLWVIDVSNPAYPTAVGRYTLGGNVFYDVAVTGSYAYLGAGNAGLRIIDITDPANPNEVGSLILPLGDVEVLDDYAYGVSDGRLQVINVSIPTAPIQVGEGITLPITIESRLSIAGNYAYLIGPDNLSVVDISNPVNPVPVSYYQATEGSSFYGEASITDHYLYLMESPQRYHSTLQVLDILDPLNPVQVNSLEASPYTIHNMTIVDHFLYVAFEGGGFSVLNITDPTHPVEVAYYLSYETGNGGKSDVLTAGGHIYNAAHESLAVIDLVSLITGSIHDSYGIPVPNVTISVGNSLITTTDMNGIYTATHLVTNNYTLTPTLSGYVFLPPVRAVAVPTLVSQNFTILPAPVSALLLTNQATTLSYTDTLGLSTQLIFPIGTTTTTATAWLTPTIARGSGFATTGHAFELTVEEENGRSAPFTFTLPVPLTIHYSETDVRVVTEETALKLYRWDGTTWVDAAVSCDAPFNLDVENNVMETAICENGRYALLGPTHQLFLPVVRLECLGLFGCQE